MAKATVVEVSSLDFGLAWLGLGWRSSCKPGGVRGGFSINPVVGLLDVPVWYRCCNVPVLVHVCYAPWALFLSPSPFPRPLPCTPAFAVGNWGQVVGAGAGFVL
jgi:hypothetical protein